jgi:membrane protein DedA with SNARE-associated domain
MNGMLVALLGDYGVLIIFAAVLIGQLGLPIPAIAVLMGAGALAGDDHGAVIAFALAGLAACTIADCLWFAIGRRYGIQVLNALYQMAHVSDAAARRMQGFFESFRVGTLVTAKFIPGLSLVAPPLSGASGMSWFPFILFSGIGSLLWVLGGLGFGVVLADEVPAILGHIGEIVWGVGAVLFVLVLAFLARRRWSRYQIATRR